MFELQPFDPASANAELLAALWNGACGSALAINSRLVRTNTLHMADVPQAGCWAIEAGQVVGWVLASTAASFGTGGWIDGLIVAPAAQRQGIGRALLAWAEQWLLAQGVTAVRLGGSLQPFAPGLPTTLMTAPFFERHGYGHGETMWDVGRDLRTYRSALPASTATVQPVGPGEEARLVAFLDRAFAGRWAWECREFLRRGGRPSDYLLVREQETIVGFAHVTWPDSVRPLERFYPQPLPQPWGQLGPLGVSAAQRGQGYGALVIDGALRHLQAGGVAGCVIDWTTLRALYARFGFETHRSYAMLSKGLSQ